MYSSWAYDVKIALVSCALDGSIDFLKLILNMQFKSYLRKRKLRFSFVPNFKENGNCCARDIFLQSNLCHSTRNRCNFIRKKEMLNVLNEKRI